MLISISKLQNGGLGRFCHSRRSSPLLLLHVGERYQVRDFRPNKKGPFLDLWMLQMGVSSSFRKKYCGRDRIDHWRWFGYWSPDGTQDGQIGSCCCDLGCQYQGK